MTGDAPTESTWQPGDPVYRPEPELRGHCGPCLVAWTGDVNRCPECGQPSTEALHARLADAEAWAAQLTDQRAAVLALADKAERGATRWADPLPVPEWVHQVRLALDGRPVAAPGADTPPPDTPAAMEAVAAVRDALRSTVWPADMAALHDHLARVAVAALAGAWPATAEMTRSGSSSSPSPHGVHPSGDPLARPAAAPTVAQPSPHDPPDDWPPTSYGPYVALRTFARSLVALDEPTMADARMVTTLADIIERARHALECGPGGDGLPTETAPCGICRLGRMVHINEACPQHGDTPW